MSNLRVIDREMGCGVVGLGGATSCGQQRKEPNGVCLWHVIGLNGVRKSRQ